MGSGIFVWGISGVKELNWIVSCFWLVRGSVLQCVWRD